MTHFIIRKADKFDECFVIIPFIENPDESLVYYYSEFATKESHLKGICEDPDMAKYLQIKRFEFLLDLKYHCSKQSKIIHKQEKTGTETKSLNQMLEESKGREMTFDERSTIIWKEFIMAPSNNSIVVGKHDSVPLELR
jgi:hypothetical protein